MNRIHGRASPSGLHRPAQQSRAHRSTPRCSCRGTPRRCRSAGTGCRREPGERLQTARHAAVAVTERMDHDEVQVGHGGPDHPGLGLLGADLSHELGDETRDVAGVRTLVHDLPGVLPADVDRPGSPSAGALREVVLQHHEMQRSNEGLVDRDARIVSELQDVGHRVPIAENRHPGLALRVERLLVVGRGNGIVQGDVVALDAVRSLDGPCRDTRRSTPTQRRGSRTTELSRPRKSVTLWRTHSSAGPRLGVLDSIRHTDG